MDVRSWTPYGRALLDFFNGKTKATVTVHEADGRKRKMPMSNFFRKSTEFPLLESTAVSLCRGRVLDIGAGAGCHSLTLQEQGFAVCAIDISPQAVEVMSKRGVKEVFCADIFDFQAEPFDTILMMMNGIGLVETPADLDRFLAIVHRLLTRNGQILLDSSDIRSTAIRNADRNSTDSTPRSDPNSNSKSNSKSDPKSESNSKSNPKSDPNSDSNSDQQSDRYIGEVKFQMEYKKEKGPPFWWLFIDPDKLTEQASKAGWSCEVIYREWDGHYLARLRPPGYVPFFIPPSDEPEMAKARLGPPAPGHPPE